jgi:hypothetical protein
LWRSFSESERLILGALATWRVTHLLAAEDGPADAVVRLRLRAGNGPLGELMDCFYCLSMWVSMPLAFVVAERRRDVPLIWLARSGAACRHEQATRESAETEKGAVDVLWEEAEGARA